MFCELHDKSIKLYKKICSYSQAGLVAITTAIMGFFAYYLILFVEVKNPDVYVEGGIFYNHADWASACGRWMTRYFMLITDNVVITAFHVIAGIVCIGVGTFLILKVCRSTKVQSTIAVSAMLVATPSVITLMTYPYLPFAYALAGCLAIVYAYLVAEHKQVSTHILASICLCISLGLYQAYLGLAVGVVVLAMLQRLLNEGMTAEWWKKGLAFLWTGILGVVLYFIGMKVDYILHPNALIDQSSLSDIIVNLPSRFLYTYQEFFAYFNDWRLKRKYLFVVLAVFLLITLVFTVYKLVRQKKWKEMVAFCIITILIPPMLNIVAIVIPYREMSTLMCYQMVLIIPFMLALMERIDVNWGKVLQMISCLICVAIAWTYVISANTTYRCYELSNRRIHLETSSILMRVLAMPEYEEGKKILFAGFVDDGELRNAYPQFWNAIDMPDNVVYWENVVGINGCRRGYLLETFGVDPGYLTPQEYNMVIQSEEFQKLENFPAENSMAEIENIIVVKISDDYPAVYPE